MSVEDDDRFEVRMSNRGCLTTIAIAIVVWAICFGVTWNGRHYGINCSCAKGVEVEQ